LAIVLASLAAALAGLMNPVLQKLFIDRLMGFTDGFLADQFLNFPTWALLTGAVLMMILASALGFLSLWLGVTEALRFQALWGEELYLKTLRRRADQMGHRTVGEVVSIYATDVPGATALLDQTLPMGAGIIFPLVFAPLMISWITELPVWIPIVFILVIILVNAVLSYRQSRFFFRFKQLAAERTGLVSEWIQNIRLLRILGWVSKYEEKIRAKRIEETANRIAMVTNGQLMGSIGSSVSFFINLSGVAALVLVQGADVTPGELLALLWIFGVFLARPLRQVPWMFTFGLDALTSLRRLESYFADRDDGELRRLPEAEVQSSFTESSRASRGAQLMVKGLNLSFNEQTVLKNINLSVDAQEFVAIVGEVGSGKSALLLSLMGEIGAEIEQFSIDGEPMLQKPLEQRRQFFGYVPQEGFVMSSSLRDNVALEYEFSDRHDEQIHHSLSAAQFVVETEAAEGRLDAEIGERGVNLSGGQRQRVSLARADFNSRPVLLLDDCLSALDAPTERKLVQELLAGRWSHHTRILVTHRLSVLNLVDRVIFLDKGTIAAQGRFRDLIENNDQFQQFAASTMERTR